MNAGNTIIHGLWIGKHLSAIELLCIHSFQANGHEFHLWVYDTIETTLPENTIVEDATKIIPREKVFCYKYADQFGHGKGSYAGFSDIFRYKLLYDHGGWWVDMDVTCLKPFDFEDSYVFRAHNDLPVVGNIMKCPPRSDLMKRSYEQAIGQIDENNTDWHKPIQILNDNICSLGLSSYIRELSNQDKWNEVRKLLYKDMKFPEHWVAIHWVNEEWRRNNLNKNIFYKGSAISKLFERYISYNSNNIKKPSLSERFKLTFPGALYIQIKSRASGFISNLKRI